jgi:two-component system cell cycle response regulator DivK
MSGPFSSEHLAHIQDDARHMVERLRDHEGHLDGLVQTSEGVARQANALSVALARADADPVELQRLCSDQVHRSVEHAEATVRVSVSAREQHAAAERLYARIGHDSPDPHEMAGSRTPVLVVDDVQDVRDLVAVVLQNAGSVVRTAANGLDALLKAYEMRPAVIVMDLAMPVLNGIEAARLIKASAATRESRIIAYTGNASIPPPIGRWFVAVVPKPATPDVVLAAVQNACNL